MNNARFKGDRHAELLAAARAVLAEKGFEATTVSEIVSRAGVAQGTFYLYFPSKFALVTELNREMNERILDALRVATTKAHTAAEVVDVSVSAVFQMIEHYKDVLRIVHSHGVFVPVIPEWEQQLGTYHHFIADLIKQRQATSEVDSTVNPEIAAKLIVGLIEYAADQCYIYDQETPQKTYVTEAIRFVQRALGIF